MVVYLAAEIAPVADGNVSKEPHRAHHHKLGQYSPFALAQRSDGSIAFNERLLDALCLQRATCGVLGIADECGDVNQPPAITDVLKVKQRPAVVRKKMDIAIVDIAMTDAVCWRCGGQVVGSLPQLGRDLEEVGIIIIVVDETRFDLRRRSDPYEVRK